MGKNQIVFRQTCLAMLVALVSGVASESVQAKSNSVTSKISGMFGRALHEQKKMKVTVMGQTKIYTGFPPREVIENGTKRLDKFNLFVDVPDYPWMCTIPKSKPSRSTLHFGCKKQKLEVLLHVDPAKGKTESSELARSQSRLRKDYNCRFSSHTSVVEAAGLSGFVYEAYTGTDRKRKKQFLVWVANDGKRDYQLIVSTESRPIESVEDAMNEFLTRVRLIEAPRVIQTQKRNASPSQTTRRLKRSEDSKIESVQWTSDQT
ncbi:MAG: hypothetical protein AAGD11_09060 [Planctomycetota bacterium]